MHRVENIEDTLKRIRVPSQCENSPSLLPNLPLMELCQLKSFEEKMVDEQFEKQLVIFILFYFSLSSNAQKRVLHKCTTLKKN